MKKYTLYTTNEQANQYWAQTQLLPGAPEYMHGINVFPQYRYQTFQGFGGAFTEAAGYTLCKLPEDAQKQVIEGYYGQDGLRYTKGRTHLGSCDFALGNYAADDDPTDTQLARFSIQRDEQYILPMIKRAGEVAGAPVELLVTPWSPPAFMKTNGDMNHGGQLKKEHAALWARYLAKYIQAYRAQGLNVTMLSVQNEPAAVQTWDSCIYSAEEEAAFVRDHLAAALAEAGLADIKIFVWDHNKDILVQRANGSLSDPKAAALIDGIAFHWYTGDHFDAVRLVAEQYPDKALWFTEGCVEYSRFNGADAVGKAEMYAHDILGNLAAGCHGWIDWNLLLDAQGGPNHVGNYCDAPMMATEDFSGVCKHLSYYYIGQFSRYIQPGAVRIATTQYTRDVEVVAFENPDGSRAVCMLNMSGREVPVAPNVEGETVHLTLAAHSIGTLVIEEA